MSALAWLRRPSSPPDASAGRRSETRRPGSASDRFASSVARPVAGIRRGARRLRRGLAAGLLSLPLLAVLATGAEAQVECSSANADGSYTVPPNWALKPSGVTGGGKFRLLFVTSTASDALAENISAYNGYVQNRAKAGHSAISDSCGNLFKVVGSTRTVDARDNTATTGTGVPIHWLKGRKVADDYADFYDGSWDNRAASDARNESGKGFTGAVGNLWTGSYSDGTARDEVGSQGHLGNQFVEVADLDHAANKPPLAANFLRHQSQSQKFYALSPVFAADKNRLTLKVSSARAAEGTSGHRDVNVTVSKPAGTRVHYSLCFSGTATLDRNGIKATGEDYRIIARNGRPQTTFGTGAKAGCIGGNLGSQSFASKATSHTWKIRVFGDTAVEADETVKVTLKQSPVSLLRLPAGWEISGSPATHTIEDDDTKRLTLKVASTKAAEGNSGYRDVDVTVSRPAGSTARVGYNLCFAGTATLDKNGTKAAGEDYQIIAPYGTPAPTGTTGATDGCLSAGTYPFGAGEDSHTWRVRVFGDTDVEGDETVVVTLGEALQTSYKLPAGWEISGTPATHTIESDETGALTLTLASAKAAEGKSGYRDVDVTVSKPAGTQRVPYRLCFSGTATLDRNGTKVAGEDYQVINYHTRVAQTSWSASGNCAITFGTPTFDAGATSHTYKIRVFGDAAGEGNETVKVTLSEGLAGAKLPPGWEISSTGNPATYTIEDDDTKLLTLEVASAKAAEGNSGSYDVDVTVSKPAGTANVIFGLCFTGTATRDENGTRVASEDYQVINHNGNVLTSWTGSGANADCVGAGGQGGSFATGDSHTWKIRVFGDTAVEADETVKVTLKESAQFPLPDDFEISGTGNPATHTIEDDDTQYLTLSVASAAAAEGASGHRDVNVTVSKPAGTANVAYGLCFTGTATLDENGTKAAGEDYRIINYDGNVLQLFGSGARAGCVGVLGGGSDFGAGDSRTYKIRVFDDTDVEPDETVVVTLSESPFTPLPDGFEISSTNNPATHTIEDDDKNRLTLKVASARAPEGNSGQRDVNVTVSKPAGTERVSYRLCFAGTAVLDENGTKVAGEDYRIIGTDGTSTQTEFGGNFGPGCVGFLGNVNFAAGEDSHTWKVRVFGDADVEDDETVVATLEESLNNPLPDGWAITPAGNPATHTIESDDTRALTLSLVSARAPEGNSGHRDVNVTVWKPTGTERVSYRLCFAGTATLDRNGAKGAGEDYRIVGTDGTSIQKTFGSGVHADCVGALGLSSFAAGEDSHTWKVRVFGDTAREADETVKVTLSEGSAGAKLPPGWEVSSAGNPAIHTIEDEDAHALTLSVASAAAAEGASGHRDVNVTVSKPAGTAAVTYGLCFTGTAMLDENGTKAAGEDYRIINFDGNVLRVFGSGARAGCVGSLGGGTAFGTGDSHTYKIRVFGDTDAESDETVKVTLSESPFTPLPDGFEISSAGNPATHTIEDDDTHRLTLEVASAKAAEADSSHRHVKVTVSKPAGTAAVSYELCFDGTATLDENGTKAAGEDYLVIRPGPGNPIQKAFTSGCVGSTTFPDGFNSDSWRIRVFGDTDAESDETVVVTLKESTTAPLPDGFEISSAGNPATHTIEDDDTNLLTLSVASAAAAEGASGHRDVNATVSKPAGTANVVFGLCFTGTAMRDENGTRVAGEDYQVINHDGNVLTSWTGSGANADCVGALGGGASFGTGDSRTYKIRVFGDTDVESSETVVVTLSESPFTPLRDGFEISSTNNPATHTIEDDDTHALTLSVASAAAAEGASGHRDVNVTVSKPAGTANVAYGLCFTGTATLDENGTKAAGEDYRIINYDGNVLQLFGSGARAGCVGVLGGGSDFGAGDSRTYKIRVFGDTDVEPDETVVVTLSESPFTPLPDGFEISSTNNPATHTIEDDDAAATVALDTGVSGFKAVLDEANSNDNLTGSTIGVAVSAAQSTAVPFRICFASSLPSPGFRVRRPDLTFYTLTKGCVDGEIPASATAGPTYNIYLEATSPTYTGSVDNPDEVVTVTVKADPDNALPAGVSIDASADDATVTILDDDPTGVWIARSAGNTGALAEGGSAKAEFQVGLVRSPKDTLTAGERVDAPLVISGTGVTTGDYVLSLKSGAGLNKGVSLTGANTLTPVVVFAGAGAKTATLELAAADDTDAEGAETVRVSLGTNADFADTDLGTTARGGANRSTATNVYHFDVPIEDDDAAATVSLDTSVKGFKAVLDEASQADGVTGSTIGVAVSAARTSAVPFRICFASSLPSPGFRVRDANDITTFHTLTKGCVDGEIPASAAAGPVYNIWLNSGSTGTTDGSDNPDEVVTVTVSEDPDNALPAGVTIDASADDATVTILDDEPTGVWILRSAGNTGALAEGGSAKAEFQVGLLRAPVDTLTAGERVDAPLAISGTGVTTGDYVLSLKSGAGLNKGVSLTGANTLTPVVVFEGKGAKTATLELAAADDTDAEGAETVRVSLGTNADFADTDLGTTARGGANRSTVTNIFHLDVDITDDDQTHGLTFTESGGATTVSEDGTVTDSYTVALASQPTHAVTVTIAAGEGVRVNKAGGTAGAIQTLTFSPGGSTNLWSTAQTITVHGVDDAIDNAGDARAVAIGHGASSTDPNYAIANAGGVSVTVSDDDTAGVTVTGTAHRVAEDGGTASYTVKLNSQPLVDVTIAVDTAGGGVVKVDGPDGATAFTATETLTFSPTASANLWSTPQTVTVEGQDDAVDNAGDRVATIAHRIQAGDNARYTPDLAIDGVAVTATDDDGRGLVLDPDAVTVAEGATATYAVRLATQPTAAVTVTVGGAGSGVTVDTDGATDGDQSTLTFNPAGATKLWSTAQTVTVSAAEDTDTASESVTLTHTAAGGDYGAERGDLEVMVADNDTAVTVAFSKRDYSVIEGDAVTVGVTLSAIRASATAVEIRSSDGTATGGGVDFDSSAITLTVPAGRTRATGTIRTVEDTSAEGNEQFRMDIHTATLPAGVTVAPAGGAGSQTHATVTITPPPAAPTLTLSHLETTALSEEGVATFSEDDTEGLEFALHVGRPYFSERYSSAIFLRHSGKATNNTFDYRMEVVSGGAVAGNGLLLFVDEGASSVRLKVVPLPDDRVEPSESFTITVQDQTQQARGLGDPRYEVGTPRSVRFTLTDGAPPMPVVSFAHAASNPYEGAGAHDVTVTLDPVPKEALTLSYTLAGDATQGADYTIESAGTVAVAAGAATATIPVVIGEDTVREADERVVLALTAPDGAGYMTGAPQTHTITIADNDGPPGVTVSAHTLALTEGGAAGSYTVALASKPTAPVTVTAGSADAGAVKVRKQGGTPGASAALTFTPATWHRTQTVTVTPADDADAADEVVAITHAVSATGGYANAPAPLVTVAVADDEAQPAVTFHYTTWAVDEGKAVSVRVDIAPVRGAPTTLGIAYGDTADTATAGTDYTAGPTAVTIPANSGSITFDVHTTKDSTEEDDEHFAIAIATLPDGVVEGDATRATVIVREGAAPPAPTLSVAMAPGEAGEGAAGSHAYATVTFGLDPVRAQPTPFKACLADTGTATRGASADYQLVGASSDTPLSLDNDDCHTYTLPAHTASGRVRLRIRGDAAVEPDETVVVELRDAPVGVVVSNALGAATYTLLDDDAVPAVTVTGAGAVTEGANAVFTVHASPAPASSLAVTLTVADDATSDFLAQGDEGTHTVVVQANQSSATLTLATTPDGTDEPDGAVTATVGSGDGYDVGTPDTATVAVADDDDPPEVTISGGGSITEGGTASFTLTATPAPLAAIEVEVEVSQTGAFAQTGTKTVTIGTNGTGTLAVVTDDDEVDEPDGAITATVQAGTGYTPSDSNGSASVAVADDDDPPVVTIAGGATVEEGGDAVFTLTATPAPPASIAVAVEVRDLSGHARSGQTGPRTVDIGTGGTGTLTVTTRDDKVDRPDGNILATVEAGQGYTPSDSNSSASVQVTDNDVPSGYPQLSVRDATADESAGVMVFTVELNRVLVGDEFVSFHYSTRESEPRSATPGVDYYPRYGSTTFRAGEQQKQFTVPIIDDSHDDGGETFEVFIQYPFGGEIDDGVGVGTITNADPMPAAWLARFGRTVAEQALDGIAGRMTASRAAGAEGTIAGQALGFGGGSQFPGAGGTDTGSQGAGEAGAVDSGIAGPPSGLIRAFAAGDVQGFGTDGSDGSRDRAMTVRDAMLGSSFTLTGEADSRGGSMAFWGRAAQSSFDGREGTFSLDGEATTAMLGADYARNRWLVGMALMQSSGEGGYQDSGAGPQECPDDTDPTMRAYPCDGAVREGDGEVEASLTAAIPYAALQASERLRLWGALGHGSGEVTLKPDPGGTLKSDISWTMMVLGLRGDVIAPPQEGSGPAVVLTSDALWARTSSDKTHELAASDSDITRLRLGLEGSWRVALDGDGSVTPKLEIGMRHDGGDAEPGFGVELGGGIAWVDPRLGLSLDLSGRTLVAHGSDDLEDRGFAASLAFDPDPASERGLSLALRQDWGGSSSDGIEALFTPDPLADRSAGADDSAPESRWTAEAAYGLPALGGRFTGSPHAGLGLGAGARDYSLGWRLTPAADTGASNLSLLIKATRMESDDTAPEHVLAVEFDAGGPDLSWRMTATQRESAGAPPEHVLGVELNARW